VTWIGVSSDGLIDPEDVRRAIRPDTILISVMHANNEIGTIQPIEEIGAIAEAADVYFHSDGVQSTGKIPVDVKALKVDLYSISSTKSMGRRAPGLCLSGKARSEAATHRRRSRAQPSFRH
jgi:cysteine desulfurase